MRWRGAYVEAACVRAVTTAQLNRIAGRELHRAGARSAFLGYRPGEAPAYHDDGNGSFTIVRITDSKLDAVTCRWLDDQRTTS